MFSIESMARGYHVYQQVWEASIGEELHLTCQRERGNLVDPFAVAVLTNGDVVGHILQKISSICCTFLRNRTITCRVIGSQLAVYFRGLKETMRHHNGRATKWLQGSMCQSWQSCRKFLNSFYFRLIVGCSNYTKIKPVRKFPRIW